MAQIVTTTFIPKDSNGYLIESYPAEVVSVEGSVLGEAADKYEFVEIWNASPVNKKVGRLFTFSEALRFKLVSQHFGGCCRIYPKFLCGGTNAQAPLLDPLELIVDEGIGPVSGTSVLTLPDTWAGKKVEVFINQGYLAPSKWVRTETGIELIDRVWNNDGPGMADEIIIRNYR